MTYKLYTTEQYVKTMSKSFFNNYGKTEAQAADWFLSQAGSAAVVNTWGVTRNDLINTYIPALKTIMNGGYMGFLMVTVTEAGGAGGWINHFPTDAPGGGLANLERDARWIMDDLFVNPYPPATTDPYGGYYQPFVEDNPGQMEHDYESMPADSIGMYFIPATLAQNTWIWGEQWSIANNVYWGNPINQFIDVMKSVGIDPFGDDETPKPNPNGDAPGGSPSAGNNPNPGNPLPPTDLTADLKTAFETFAKGIIDEYSKLLGKQLFRGSEQYNFNSYMKMTRTFNNTFQIKQTPTFKKSINDVMSKTMNGDLIPKPAPQPNNSNASDGKKPSDDGENVVPNIPTGDDTANKIYQWALARQGQAFDPDGMYGAQCVDLIHQVSISLNLGLDTSGVYAKDIWNNEVPAHWHKITADPTNDADGKAKWGTVPNGAIVWITNAYAGHVAIKSGDYAQALQQNWNTDGSGGPIVDANMGGWISAGGGGIEGFWVPGDA